MFRTARAIADAGGKGPYPATLVVEPALPVHVVYRPRNLAQVKGKIPVVAFGNGGCMGRADLNRYLLTELASHGYLVVVPGRIGSNDLEDVLARLGQAKKDEVPTADLMKLVAELTPDEPKVTKTIALTQALDWAVAENARKGSPYYRRIDVAHLAVAGGSCGGLQAIRVTARDPRVKAAFFMNSGTLPPKPKPTDEDATRDDVRNFKVPVAYVSGDATDVAYPGAEGDFDAITAVPAYRAYLKGVGHEGTSLEPQGGAIGRVMIEWFDWQLKGDRLAARTFTGADCRLCSDPKWVVRRKNID